MAEPGQAALRAELSRWDGYVSSALLGTEAVRACRRYGDRYAEIAREWLVGVALIPVDDAILDAASSLHPTGLRSLDAIHLATALDVRDEIGAFVTYDERLAQPARDHGISVVAPA